MRPTRNPLSRSLIVLVVLVALALAGCGAATGSGQTTGGTPSAHATATAAATATATAKPVPTVAPVVTQAFCQSAMTVAQANQIMNPPTPATTIEVQSTEGELGVCRYTSAGAQFPVVSILIDYKLYTGPKPVPVPTIEQYATQLAEEPGLTVTTTAAVTGVGDQAEFLAANLSQSGQTFYADAFYVIYGQVVFMCDDFHLNTKTDDAAQQSALTQCAQNVAKVL